MTRVLVTQTFTLSAHLEVPEDFDVDNDDLTAAQLWAMRRGVELADLDAQPYKIEWVFA